MSDVGSPPAQAIWDVDDIAKRAMAVLRLDGDDVDADRVADAAAAAVEDVDTYVDRTQPAAPSARMVDAAVARTIGRYRGKDAPFGIADAWSQDTVAVDLLAPSPAPALLGDKERWGLA